MTDIVDHKSTIFGWLWDGAKTVLMVIAFVAFFFAGVVAHEPGQEVIDFFTPMVSEWIAEANEPPTDNKAGAPVIDRSSFTANM